MADSDLNSSDLPIPAPSDVSPEPLPSPLAESPKSPPAEIAARPARKRGRLGRGIRWLFFGVLLVIGLAIAASLHWGAALVALFSGEETGLSERYHSLNRYSANKVAILQLDGVILHGDGFVKRQIDAIREDRSVKAIVLRVNSPGGSVTASDYLHHHLKKLALERDLPIVISMGGIAASGAYYISMAAGDTPNIIYAEPTTWTGSIGVVIPHYNVAGLLNRFEVEEDSVKSHRLKSMGSPARRMSVEERDIFQALVDDGFRRFKEIVKEGRAKFRDNDAELEKIATGQVYTTRQALENGLVDREGFLEDAIARALELAGLGKEEAKAVVYERPFSLNSLFLGDISKAKSRSDLESILDLATPRAYYLWSWPPLSPDEAD